jgi:hypothetical protein
MLSVLALEMYVEIMSPVLYCIELLTSVDSPTVVSVYIFVSVTGML